MTRKFVHLNKYTAEEFKFPSQARAEKFVSVEYIQAWINNNRLNTNPPPFDKQTIAQNEVYAQLEALINETELQ